jgi:hypothetical protein
VAYEGLQSTKIRNLRDMVVKVVLLKLYDKINWLYLRLMLLHLGFCVHFVIWVMNCVYFVYLCVLINGSTSHFFKHERGLRQGCSLYPLPFLL